MGAASPPLWLAALLPFAQVASWIWTGAPALLRSLDEALAWLLADRGRHDERGAW